MSNTLENPSIQSTTEHDIPPLKKTHPIFNSLVLRILISASLTGMLYFSDDAEIVSLIREAGAAFVFVLVFTVYLILISIAESLGLLMFSALRRLARVGHKN